MVKLLICTFVDLIAIPDFVSGAMENWGLITFRETSVLYDPDFSSISNHLAVTLTLTHELAHMWFGDLGKCLMPVEWQTQVNVGRGVYLKIRLRTGTYSHYRQLAISF